MDPSNERILMQCLNFQWQHLEVFQKLNEQIWSDLHLLSPKYLILYPELIIKIVIRIKKRKVCIKYNSILKINQQNQTVNTCP